MDITVRKREKYGVTINRYGLEDARLSFKAKGILAYLMTKPEGWQVNSVHLSKVCKDGRDAILTGLDELGEAGYFTRKRTKNKSGQWEWQQEMFDFPNPARAKSYHDWKTRLRKSPTDSNPKNITSRREGRSNTKALGTDICSSCGGSSAARSCWCVAS